MVESDLMWKRRESGGLAYNFIDGGVIRVWSFLNNSPRAKSQGQPLPKVIYLHPWQREVHRQDKKSKKDDNESRVGQQWCDQGDRRVQREAVDQIDEGGGEVRGIGGVLVLEVFGLRVNQNSKQSVVVAGEGHMARFGSRGRAGQVVQVQPGGEGPLEPLRLTVILKRSGDFKHFYEIMWRALRLPIGINMLW